MPNYTLINAPFSSSHFLFNIFTISSVIQVTYLIDIYKYIFIKIIKIKNFWELSASKWELINSKSLILA